MNRKRWLVPSLHSWRGVLKMADFVVSLKQSEYQSSLNALRSYLEEKRTGYLDIALKLPNSAVPVELQMRCRDLYVIGFKGADGWYHFDNEEGGWGKSCGVGSNYNNLAPVTQVTTASVDNLGELASFRSGQKLKTELAVIAVAVISEALRFATVATYFTGLFNGFYKGFPLGPTVPLKALKTKYFLNWDELTKSRSTDVLIKK